MKFSISIFVVLAWTLQASAQNPSHDGSVIQGTEVSKPHSTAESLNWAKKMPPYLKCSDELEKAVDGKLTVNGKKSEDDHLHVAPKFVVADRNGKPGLYWYSAVGHYEQGVPEIYFQTLDEAKRVSAPGASEVVYKFDVKEPGEEAWPQSFEVRIPKVDFENGSYLRASLTEDEARLARHFRAKTATAEYEDSNVPYPTEVVQDSRGVVAFKNRLAQIADYAQSHPEIEEGYVKSALKMTTKESPYKGAISEIESAASLPVLAIEKLEKIREAHRRNVESEVFTYPSGPQLSGVEAKDLALVLIPQGSGLDWKNVYGMLHDNANGKARLVKALKQAPAKTGLDEATAGLKQCLSLPSAPKIVEAAGNINRWIVTQYELLP